MPTLGDLWQAAFPGARPHLATSTAAERQVAWVRVMKPRVPAFDVLEADDLAIVPRSTLESLAALAIEPASVADAVAAARGSGLLLVGEVASAPDPAAALLEAAAGLGLGAFRLADGDVAALERSAIAYIVNAQAELERRASELEAALEQQALAGAGPEGLAATIARFLGRAVALEAAEGAVLALHAPPAASDAAAQVAEYIRRRRGAALRVVLPAAGSSGRSSRRGSGALVLLGSGPVTELERVSTARVVGLLALELARAGTAPAGERTEGLPSAGPPWVVLVARQLDETEPQTVEERERVRQELRRAEPPRRLALRGDAASVELRMVAAPDEGDARGLAIARRISRRLGRPVAVSRPFSDATDRPPMEAQARAALEALEALPAAERRRLADADGALVAPTELAPAYALLAGLPFLPDAARHAHALLQPILGGRARTDRDALATLRAVLDHPGMAEAAAALGVHRNTLAYRLHRLEQRTGWRLADPLLRASLGIAVRVVQNAQDSRGTPDTGSPLRGRVGR